MESGTLIWIAALIAIILVIVYLSGSIRAANSEKFSPYITTALPEIYRSDATFDHLNDKHYGNREDYLFDQLLALTRANSTT